MSDLIRFGPGFVVFYSDLTTIRDSLADNPFPTQLSLNYVTLAEQGTENGWNGFHYTPLPGQPGYSDTLHVEYTFISAVPEPTTMVAGVGAIGLLLASMVSRSRRSSVARIIK